MAGRLASLTARSAAKDSEPPALQNGGPPPPDSQSRSYASGARILSIGIASTGHLHVRLPGHGQPRAQPAGLRPGIAVLGGHVRDPVGDLPADRAAALAHDRRSPRARPARAIRCVVPALIQSGFALLFLIAALALRPEIEKQPVRRLEPRCTGSSSSACWPTRRATSPAAGSPATSASRSTAGSCSSSRPRASCSRWRRRSGSPRARGRSRSGWRWRRSCRCAWSRSRSRAIGSRASHGHPRRRRRPRGPRPRPGRGGDRRTCRSRCGTGFAIAVVCIMLAEQTLMNAAVLIVNHDSGTGAGRLRVQRAADRARAAAAVPGDPDLDPPPPRRARGARQRRGLPQGDPRSRSWRSPRSPAPCALGLLLIGPFVMTAAAGQQGLPLRPLRARAGGPRDGPAPGRRHAQPGRAGPRPRRPWRLSRGCVAAALFVGSWPPPTISNEVTRVEVGYFAAALVLSGLLFIVYRRGAATPAAEASAA